MSEQRLDRLERVVADLETRLAAVESPRGPAVDTPRVSAAATPRAPAARRAPVRPAAAPSPRPAAAAPELPRPVWLDSKFRLDLDREGLEDLVGGRVLAWAGGLTVLLGIVFLFALGISNGWIDETARVVLGALGSATLLVLGVWLHERKARTDAALAATATGVAGLFVTGTVATQVYELVPQLPAVGILVGVGAVATALALRWESRGIAALGILGALAAPPLAGVAGDGGTMLILFVALASAAAVLLKQRWDWLALAAFVVATPQWVEYVVNGASLSQELGVLVGFGILGVAVAVGHDARMKDERLRSSSAYLFALNAIVISMVGWVALGDGGQAWLAGVALVHIVVGLLGPRLVGLSDDLRLLALATGILAGDVAFGLIADGAVLALGWAAAGTAFAALVRRVSAAGDGDPAATALAHAGLGGHLSLSLLSAFAASDPTLVISGEEPLSMTGAAAVAGLAAACLVSAQVAGDRNEFWKPMLNAAGLAAVAALTLMCLDGLQLVLAWTAEAVVLGAIARRTGETEAGWGAVGFLGLAALHALAFEAPPVSLVTGLDDPIAAGVALASVAVGALVLANWLPGEDGEADPALRGAAVLALFYLASAAVVTPFETDAAVDSALMSAHQQGQMVLSVFWGLVGVSTVIVGLRRDLGYVRIVGLALIGVTLGKLFLFDLSALDAGYRVVSFIALGLMLLGGALVWQRLRPRALSDLRETPAGVR